MLTPDPEVVILGLGLRLARHHLGRDVTETVLRLDGEPAGNRLNDAGVGPDGSLYFGTMDEGETRPVGSFQRWSPAGLHGFGARAVVTNGPAVDGVRGLLYAADTQAGRVVRHRLGPDGTPGEAELFVSFAPGWGHPDGLTVDAESHLWICHWGGGRVTRFSPEGEPVLEVPVPTGQPTKVAFGGPDLATMYITSAAIGRDRETDLQAGHLFAVETGIRGLPPSYCRMPAP